MASGKSAHLANALLAQLFNSAAAVSLANVYVALFTAAPTGSGGSYTGGTEATGGGYARLAVETADTTKWTVTANGVVNAATISMFTASGAVSSSANIVGVGLMDAITSGNLLYYGDVVTPAAITASGQVPTFTGGSLAVTET